MSFKLAIRNLFAQYIRQLVVAGQLVIGINYLRHRFLLHILHETFSEDTYKRLKKLVLFKLVVAKWIKFKEWGYILKSSAIQFDQERLNSKKDD